MLPSRPDAQFDHLSLLDLVDPHGIDTLDIARAIGQRRAADVAGIQILDLIKAVLQDIRRFELFQGVFRMASRKASTWIMASRIPPSYMMWVTHLLG